MWKRNKEHCTCVDTLEDLKERFDELERKVKREQHFEEWRATRAASGGGFGFAPTPYNSRPPEVTA